MSNAIMPSPVAPNWGIPWPIHKTPSYATLVQTPANKRGEVRISLMQYPIWVFEFDLGYLKGDMSTPQVSSAFQQIIGFFGQMQGAGSDFLYHDPYDNSSTGQLLGYGDGVTQQFQLVRNTGGMVDLMQTALPTAVYLNGVPVNAAPQPSGAVWYCGIENLLLNSQSFSSVWSATNCTPTDNLTTAPDGTSTGAVLSFGSHGANSFAGISQGVAINTALPATVTCSIWLKAAGPQTVEIAAVVLSANGLAVANTVVTSASINASWQRFTVTVNVLQGQGSTVYMQVRSPFAPSESAFAIYAWGAQMERWTSATGYNPTTTAANIPQGLITFGGAVGSGIAVTADFTFYYRVRLLDDTWKNLMEEVYQIWSMKSLKFKSILL